jgi:hypothetical protein
VKESPNTFAFVIALLAGGGAGTGGSALLGMGANDETAYAVDALEDDVEALAAAIEELDDHQRLNEREVDRANNRTLRWLAGVLVQQSKAIGSLAEASGVEVDVYVDTRELLELGEDDRR